MENTIIRNVKIYQSDSNTFSSETDVLTDGKKILEILPGINNENAKSINGKGCILSPSFIDLRTSCGEPGEEWKETFESLSSAALSGGYTHVLLMPDTNPVISNVSKVNYIIQKTKLLPVYFIPSATVTVDAAGERLTDMHDLNKNGVKVFFDGKQSIRNLRLMMIAQQYVSDFGGKIFHFAHDKTFNTSSFVNESLNSLKAGMKGMPNLAEAAIVARDIQLAHYTKLPLHIAGVSTKESVDLIREAKQNGVPVTCDVHVNNLFFSDDELIKFNSNYKVNPPLRSTSDIKALTDAINENTIDAIVSDHKPQNVELKNVEFDFAAEGTITIEHSFLMAYNSLKNYVTLEKIISLFTKGPSALIGLEKHEIRIGNDANMVLLDLNSETYPGLSRFKSLSSNSPFNGKTKLQGKIIQTFTAKK